MPERGTALNKGQLADFVGEAVKALVLMSDKLGPDLAHNLAKNGQSMERTFLRALVPPSEGQQSAVDRLANLPLWRTLTIGGYSREELLQMLEAEKFRLSDWGRDVMTRPEFVTSATPYTIRLGRVRVGDLGFTGWTKTPVLFKKLVEHFDECPPETGPHLRRIYRDQPKDEWLSVYQKPIVGSVGDPGVFVLEANSDGLLLGACVAGPEYEWPPENGFVVRLRE